MSVFDLATNVTQSIAMNTYQADATVQRAIANGVIAGMYSYSQDRNLDNAIADAITSSVVSYGVEVLFDKVLKPMNVIPDDAVLATQTVLQSSIYGIYKMIQNNTRIYYDSDRTKAIYDDVLVAGLANIGVHIFLTA